MVTIFFFPSRIFALWSSFPPLFPNWVKPFCGDFISQKKADKKFTNTAVFWPFFTEEYLFLSDVQLDLKGKGMPWGFLLWFSGFYGTSTLINISGMSDMIHWLFITFHNRNLLFNNQDGGARCIRSTKFLLCSFLLIELSQLCSLVVRTAPLRNQLKKNVLLIGRYNHSSAAES